MIVKLASAPDRVRFCSELHAAIALLGEAALHATPAMSLPPFLLQLNRLAGTYLTQQTATPTRVRAALDRAAAHVLAELDEWQRAQDRHRPTLAQVQDEMVTGRAAPEDDDEEEPLAQEAAGA